MAEYKNVEKPFLEKLKQLHWQVIDQGGFGIPQDPTISLRSSFREVTLKETFKAAISKINSSNGVEWLTDKQLEDLYHEVTALEKSNQALLEVNQAVFEKLTGKTKTTIPENERTGEKNIAIKLIDFQNWNNNSFVAINQFRVVTPGGSREGIIPDIVLFINGLPLIVIECKDVDVTDPISSAVDQMQRYANLRENESSAKEGEERLFHYNAFTIVSNGEEARFGTITGSYEYYLNWKDIFPEHYKTINTLNYVNEEQERYQNGGLFKNPNLRQEVLIQGMLNKEILLDVLAHFTFFTTSDNGQTIKIVSRYQQYRAVGKIIDRLRNGENPDERSGVVWHTQGSGKSLTMMFFIKKLRSQSDLKDYKVIIMIDRKDLETQLSKDAVLTGEFKEKNIVNSRKELQKKLSTDSSDLNMVMIHKFIQEELKHAKTLMKAFVSQKEVPEFKPFDIINPSERIVLLIDEAHRSQGGDMGDNLFKAFPNAAKIGFTGTPLLTDRHKRKTHERFGGSEEFIDTYKIREAVDDRATLGIIYVGKTSNDTIKNKQAFDSNFEDMFKDRTKEETEAIKQRYGTMQAYLENSERIKKIATDLVNHYITEILPDGYKAMVVASSVLAAARYQKHIIEAIKERIAIEENQLKIDLDLIEKLKFLDACTVVTQQDNNEEGLISEVRKKAKELKAVDSFKKSFDYTVDENGAYKNPQTGIAFICVCDRLLTGFDAPIAQVMYLDKNLKEHELMQAIARVNRTRGKKSHGLLVDYFGVTENIKTALGIWGTTDNEDIQDLLSYFRDINKEIPVLEARYNRMLQLFTDHGVKDFQKFIEQKIEDKDYEFEIAETCIEMAESLAFRAQFDTYLKTFFDSLDLLFNTSAADKYYIQAQRFGYLLMRIRNRYKDETLDLKWAKAKIRKLIDEHLVSLGINSRIAPVDILSDKFKLEVGRFNRTSKSKASEMEHAIRRHIKVNMDKDPGLYQKFLERIEQIIERYKDNWEQIITELEKVKDDLEKGRDLEVAETGLTIQELPFYDIIAINAFKNSKVELEETKITLKELVKDLILLLQDAINKPNFWKEREAEIRKLQGEIDDLLDFSGIDEVSSAKERLSIEILNLAKRRHQELTIEI